MRPAPDAAGYERGKPAEEELQLGRNATTDRTSARDACLHAMNLDAELAFEPSTLAPKCLVDFRTGILRLPGQHIDGEPDFHQPTRDIDAVRRRANFFRRIVLG